MSRHAVIKVRLRAVIGDFEFKDVVQYTGAFAMNSIPVASILVAVGRNVETDALATIHNAVNSLNVQLKAEVFLATDITSVEQATPGVPDNFQEIKIFEGKTVGAGWRRTENGAHFTINLLHWLGDLNYASAVSASSHPGNPADLTYPAIFRAIGPASTDPTSGSPSWVPMLSEGFVNSGALSDIWGNVLHKWMLSVAQDDPFDKALLGGQSGGGDQNTIDALNRIGPNGDGRTLNLVTGGANRDVVASGLRQALMNETGGNWINTTLWGKLVGEWAPAYWFSVIPRVDDALIVPFTGGLQGEPWAVIGDEDYAQADLNSQMHQVLRAVGIVHPIMFFSGIDMNKGAIPLDRGGCAGWYQPDGIKKGMVLLKDAPKWLSDPIIAYEFSRAAEGIEGAPINTNLDPDGTGQPRQPARDLGDVQTGHKDILTLYAKQWYVLEVLKGRVGEVSGKLRFDIAPGSNVLVEAGGARNVPLANAIQENIYATVTQVSYVINAESQKAGTAFSLAHIRTEKENQTEGMSIGKPPLYQDAWPGAMLVTTAPGPEAAE